MTSYMDHHTLALLSIANACLELINTQPDTDVVIELRVLLEDQFDILQCVLHNRHFGSDDLDLVIQNCSNVLAQIRELDDK